MRQKTGATKGNLRGNAVLSVSHGTKSTFIRTETQISLWNIPKYQKEMEGMIEEVPSHQLRSVPMSI